MIRAVDTLRHKFLTDGGYARIYLVFSGVPASVHGREVEVSNFLRGFLD